MIEHIVEQLGSCIDTWTEHNGELPRHIFLGQALISVIAPSRTNDELEFASEVLRHNYDVEGSEGSAGAYLNIHAYNGPNRLAIILGEEYVYEDPPKTRKSAVSHGEESGAAGVDTDAS